MMLGAPPRANAASLEAAIAIVVAAPAIASFRAVFIFRRLWLLKFRDRLHPACFAGGKADPVAGVPRLERHAILDFELFGSAAGIGSDGAALRLLDRDRAADPVEFGNPSRQRLLSQSY